MPVTVEQCPLCGTELSAVKLKEIHAKLSREEQEKSASQAQAESALQSRLEQQFKQQMETQRQMLENKARENAEAQNKMIVAERESTARKLKEAEARETQVREEAQRELAKEKLAVEAKAKLKATEQIGQAVAERDKILGQLKELELREEEIRKAALNEIEVQKQAAEKKARSETAEQIGKLTAERNEAAAKASEAEAREAIVRQDAARNAEERVRAAEAKVKADAAVEMQKVALERDLAAAKAKELETREAASRKQITEDADRRLAEQRKSLETDKNLALLKQQSEFNRERESLQKRLQKKTANELGDGAEIDLHNALRESYPTDTTSRVKKGQFGADIIHEVFYKGVSCGRIIIDSKNCQDWQHTWVTKLRRDQSEAGAEHAILATTVFPPRKKELCTESDVIVTAPAHVVHIVGLLRKAMVAIHIKGLSMKERSAKMARLYALITSESYSGKLVEAGRLTADILELDVKEKKAHDNVWKTRGALAKRMQNVLRDAETEVAAVIESTDDGGTQHSFGVRTATASATSARAREIV